MKIKEKIAQNNEYIALLPAGQFRDELIAENEELYKKLKEFGVKKIKRKKGKTVFNFGKEIFMNHKNKYFKISEITEEMEERETQAGVENYKNNKI